MFIEKNEFRLKFGKAKEAISIWKEMLDEMKKQNVSGLRISTDLTGPAYTLVLEGTLEGWSSIDTRKNEWGNNPKVRELYQKFLPLCESSHKTYYQVEAEI